MVQLVTYFVAKHEKNRIMQFKAVKTCFLMIE